MRHYVVAKIISEISIHEGPYAPIRHRGYHLSTGKLKPSLRTFENAPKIKCTLFGIYHV